MAELIVPTIIDQLRDVILKQLGEKVKLVMGVEEEVANISSKLATIENVLHDAERQRLRDRSVGIWLEKLEDITYEMDDVLDEWNFKIHRAKNEGTHQNARLQPTLWIKVRSLIPSLCSFLKQVLVRSDIAQKIKKINAQLEITLNEGDQFKFITSGGILDSQDFKPIMTTSIIDKSEVYGRESDKDDLLKLVLSESSIQRRDGVQVISVVGAGGSGKTTLAQLLFNDDRVKNHFELKKWVCVSHSFDEKRVVQAILESPGKSAPDLSQLETFLQLLKDTFSGKRFLLVLDDVWTEDDSEWKPFHDSLKDGAPGSVILVTTRNQRVAKVVGTTYTHQISLMSDSDCWLIMRKIAFGGRSEELCKKKERIGQKIAEKCKGLPLAAKTMGGLLRFKDTVQQWQNVSDNNIWQSTEVAEELFRHLYLSYNELSPELKRCFSYCAVFPKDHEIDVEELIRLWIAQGYVRPRRRRERLELVGREHFNNLAMRSFFQEIQNVEYYYVLHEMRCKMHDIVHEFAQNLRKNECHGIGRNSSSERPRHLTILEGTQEEMFNSRVVDFGRLRSFITFSEIGSFINPQNLFCSLKCVRILTLCHCGLPKVPAKIGRLIHLRHLDLSRNPFVTLPKAVCDLYYLETLDISFCEKLSCLPERIEDLVHLRQLLNHGTSELRQIPQGLGKLMSLCTLTRFIVRSNSDDLAILKDLNQLEILYIDIYGEINFGGAEFEKKVDLRGMSLFFNFGTHFIETPSCIETMKPPPNLERLRLAGYPGAQLPSWFVTKSLTKPQTSIPVSNVNNLERSSQMSISKLDVNNLARLSQTSIAELNVNNLARLIINGPCNISSLFALWKLSSLEELVLWGAEKMECLDKEFFEVTKALHENSRDALDPLSNSESSSSAKAIAFPNLRKLHFHDLPNWTNWEDLSEEIAVSIMPSLEELKIEYCEKLEALPHHILSKISSLKNLDIQHCSKLRDCYSDKTGDDWKKISHNLQVHIF